jgi:Fe-S oxidoreductase
MTRAKQRPITLDDARWERVMAATDGAVAPCFQCGVCTATCPWTLLQEEPANVRMLMRRAQLGVAEQDGEMWWCTTCRACEELCPRGVPIADVMLALRNLAWQDKQVPAGISPVMWSLYWDGNPWRRPPSQRSAWMRDGEIKQFDSTDDVLFYAGCTASYDNRSQKVARALVGLLTAAGVSFGSLRDDEPCCGDAAYALGQHDYLRAIISANSSRFEEAGVGTVVTVSPHCYDMFLNHYPQRDGFQPLHYTQYLADLISGGRLGFKNQYPSKATFHDPCYLGRRNDEYDAPRQVLSAIPGLELVEMPQNRAEALCCGGGGGRMWVETKAGERFSDLRVKEAMDTGAEVLVTACPHCIACLEDSLRQAGSPMRVMDVAEVVSEAVNGGRSA